MTRIIALLVALLAYLAPPIWAHFAVEADAKMQMATRGWVCGNPIIGILFFAGLGSCALSLVATGFGVAAFRALPKPRSKMRIVELGFLSLPFFLAGSYAIFLYCV